jgi:hypothetical protein
MSKAVSSNISDLLTSEQHVESSAQGMADLYFLLVPRQTLEKLTTEAERRGLTLAEALGQALGNWLQGESNE